MSNYILHLIDKNPVNNQTILCSSGQEVLFHKNEAMKRGFQVKVSKAKKVKQKPVGVVIVDLNGNTRSGQNVFDEYIKDLENIENNKINMEGKVK